MGGSGKSTGTTATSPGSKWRNGTAKLTLNGDVPSNFQTAIREGLGEIADSDSRLAELVDLLYNDGQHSFEVEDTVEYAGAFDYNRNITSLSTAPGMFWRQGPDFSPTRYNPYGGIRAAVVHEVGHGIAFHAIGTQKQQNGLVQKAFNNYNKQYGPTTRKDFVNKISEYGSFNSAEAIAEAFVDVVMNKGKASIPSRFIYDELLSRVK